MALQNTDLLPLYRITDSSNRKISVADFTTYLANFTQEPVIISDTAPNPATEGQLYWDITDATLYVYYDNAGNGGWVPATPVPSAETYVSLDDEGTEQTITGGGGLKIEGDLQALNYRIDLLQELV